ncbi:hypothetical protein [Dyadobacter sandarakinus]|uniref:Oligosaccharide repeat unit polymerase n=1 Tax=Dyadobacter sandarakinus TaxID=2747268 RepID=A0ABX7IE47_9BACT|nr:hypothetical protein [Dyadobacter sandarakinus]QRR03393.1 hypothetical protein HWI92_22015 [Dyadobacter sandarakinus]
MRASELFSLLFDNLQLFTIVYGAFLLLYFVVYKKAYWGILDPMFLTVINFAGGAFCVWLLWYMDTLKPEYGLSFIYTEIAILAGMIVSHQLPVLKVYNDKIPEFKPDEQVGTDEFEVFVFLVCCFYIVFEIVSLATVGLVIVSDSESHVTAFSDHSVLRVFISSFRSLAIVSLFYKRIVRGKKWNMLEVLTLMLLLVGVLSSGAKGAIVIFIHSYFILTFPMIRTGKMQKIKLSLPVILLIASFPVAVLIIKVGAGAESALQQLYLRFMSSGDVFLLGYYENVMNSITETSFFKYAFYPGWGTVLKNLGFDITPPRLIGSDIFEYYTNMTSGGGPNARHNFIAYYFFGLYGGIGYSFCVGLFVGYMRNIYKYVHPFKMSYATYLFFALIALKVPTLIDDINVYSNFIFWTILFLFVCYILAKVIFLILQNAHRNKVTLAPPTS